MNDTAALDALIEAVEAGTAMNSDFADAFPATGPSKPYWMATSAYNNNSLDAAKALHGELLPGLFPGMSKNIHHGHWYAWVQDKATAHFSAVEPDPARAWLIAILKAYRAQVTQ